VLRALPPAQAHVQFGPYSLVGNIAGRLCGTQNEMCHHAVCLVDLATNPRHQPVLPLWFDGGGDLFDAVQAITLICPCIGQEPQIIQTITGVQRIDVDTCTINNV
jgi:hypothetical protein